MSKLFLRYEPTTDPEILAFIAKYPQHANKNRKRDVQAYHDEAATQRACRWAWWRSHPTRAWKRITLNFASSPIVWLPDLGADA